MSRPTYMTIDLGALRHNLKKVREFAPHSEVLAMVKANAYGHGLERVATALSNVDAFGVASLEEGIQLRKANIKGPIVLMEGLFYSDEIKEAQEHDFTLVVHHQRHVDMLEAASIKHPFRIWLKINTGMHRLGFDLSEIQKTYSRLMALHSVQHPINLMTHFAEADLTSSPTTLQQLNLFRQSTKHLQGLRSLANSAAILAWPESHCDWVRPGLMIYGASPFKDKTGLDFDLQPVMTLTSRIIAITKVKKGGKVGYGGLWEAPEDMSIGIVGVGYGDGYPQFAGNGTPVLVNNAECSLVGKVSMDMLAVDLRNQPQTEIGDTVVLWGKGLPVERIALHNQTSAYEILTRMTPRPNILIKPPIPNLVNELIND